MPTKMLANASMTTRFIGLDTVPARARVLKWTSRQGKARGCEKPTQACDVLSDAADGAAGWRSVERDLRRRLADRHVLGSRRRDVTHEITLDPVVATGCNLTEMTMPRTERMPVMRRQQRLKINGRRGRIWSAGGFKPMRSAARPVWPRGTAVQETS